jgi:hypothetical protein
MTIESLKSSEKSIIRAGKEFLKLVYGGRPVPVKAVFFLRNFVGGENPLSPTALDVTTKGIMLNNLFLGEMLPNADLGDWSLGVDTLNSLEKYLQNKCPQTILEFGSGISTVCQARYMWELYGATDRVYVFSIEQNADQVQETLHLLRKTGLEKHVAILHAPLKRQKIDGIEKECYDLDKVEDFLNGVRPDFILIDGPYAESGGRFGVIPLIQPFVDNEAEFWMDDAVRDPELEIARLWEKGQYAKIYGLSLMDKGILKGKILKTQGSKGEHERAAHKHSYSGV